MPGHSSSNCHQSCSEELQAEIQAAIAKMCGTVENVYFQQDADYNNVKKSKKDEPLMHRFMLSFLIPCPKQNPRVEDEKELENSGTPFPPPPPCEADLAKIAIVRCPPMVVEQRSVETQTGEIEETPADIVAVDEMSNEVDADEDMDTTEPASLIRDDIFELQSQSTTDGRQDEELMESAREFSDLIDLQAGCFPLTPEELHAAIDSQLSKTSPDVKVDWRSSLFNDVGCISPPTSPTTANNGLLTADASPMQQSSEVSSSCRGAISPTTTTPTTQQDSKPYTPNITIPYTGQLVHTKSPVVGSLKLDFPAKPQQLLCPANLPAVSALVGGPLGWSISRTPSSRPTIVRLAKQFQTHRTSLTSRPSLLLPKNSQQKLSSAMEIVTKSRSRKKSPLRKTIDQSEEPQSQFSELPLAVPKGYTYESWILEEGLHKIRQQGLHKTEDKDAYPYACPACDKKYKNPNGIKYHARYAHGPKNVFFCEICKREYSTRHGLSAHRKTHLISTPTNPSAPTSTPSYTCEVINGNESDGADSNNATTTVYITSLPPGLKI